MNGAWSVLREVVPIVGPVPPASSTRDALLFAFQYDPFELSLIVAAVLLDIAVAIEMLAFLKHARNHENDLRPLAWVRYVVYGFALIESGSLKREKIPFHGTLCRYLGGIVFFGAAASLVYYDLAIATVADGKWGIVLLHLFGAMFLGLALCGALLPVVAAPIIYLSTLKRAASAF